MSPCYSRDTETLPNLLPVFCLEVMVAVWGIRLFSPKVQGRERETICFNKSSICTIMFSAPQHLTFILSSEVPQVRTCLPATALCALYEKPAAWFSEFCFPSLPTTVASEHFLFPCAASTPWLVGTNRTWHLSDSELSLGREGKRWNSFPWRNTVRSSVWHSQVQTVSESITELNTIIQIMFLNTNGLSDNATELNTSQDGSRLLMVVTFSSPRIRSSLLKQAASLLY